jgi:hypothetical protein
LVLGPEGREEPERAWADAIAAAVRGHTLVTTRELEPHALRLLETLEVKVVVVDERAAATLRPGLRRS